MDRKRLQIGPAADAAAPAPKPWRATISSRFAAATARGAQWFVSPPVVVATSVLAGAVCAVTGVSMLAGAPWALIAAALILFGLAALILRGMNG